jgi:hypothetical protein
MFWVILPRFYAHLSDSFKLIADVAVYIIKDNLDKEIQILKMNIAIVSCYIATLPIQYFLWHKSYLA